jgi:hypothetical protein
MRDFPYHAISRTLRKAIYHFEDVTQAPGEMVTSSVLCAISLACQSLIKVKITDNIVSPVSLYSFVIADSGERKTTVDKLVFKPFHERDRRALLQYEEQKKEHERRSKIWSKKENALMKCIEKATMKGICTNEFSRQLEALYAEKPVPPKARRYIYNNVTPEALQLEMHINSPQTGLITDEGANILDRQAMNDPGFINSMWDGGILVLIEKQDRALRLGVGVLRCLS